MIESDRIPSSYTFPHFHFDKNLLFTDLSKFSIF